MVEAQRKSILVMKALAAAGWLRKGKRFCAAALLLCHALICQGENLWNESGHRMHTQPTLPEQNNALYWRVLRIRKLIAQRRLFFLTGAQRRARANCRLILHLFASRCIKEHDRRDNFSRAVAKRVDIHIQEKIGIGWNRDRAPCKWHNFTVSLRWPPRLLPFF